MGISRRTFEIFGDYALFMIGATRESPTGVYVQVACAHTRSEGDRLVNGLANKVCKLQTRVLGNLLGRLPYT